MRIAVVMGGTSHEAEISLKSGKAVVDALETAGFSVIPVELTKDSIDEIPRDVDAVFIALHGGYGEGGGIQADLNAIKMPYTGPGVMTCQIAMDKNSTKAVLRQAGLPVPDSVKITLASANEAIPMSLPLVVKPPCDGSSVGITKVEKAKDWASAVALAVQADPNGEAMAEAYISGVEWTVSVVDGVALPVIEIQAPDGWYDFHAKYTVGSTQYVFPEESDLMKMVQRMAEKVYCALACRSVCRVDFRVTLHGEPYILEVNTIPGCTATSLLPKAAGRAGIPFPELCKKLVLKATHD